MNASWRRLVACVAVVAASAGLALWLEAPKKKAARPAPPISRTANSALTSPLTGGVANVAAPGNVASTIAAAAARLRNADSSDTGLRQLNALRQALSALPAKEASAAIRHFLDSREDAPTRQGFKIGAKGLLDQAPSLRVFLLDYLERVDPAAAAAYARTILSSMDSPDEWAVALRNLAMGDDSPDARALLTQKTKEMFQNALWQQNPSVGFLEAFDMAAYSGGTELVPTLTELLRNPENPAVAHAAYLALDRLIISEPATLLAALEAEPDLMQGRELTRADYFARADVRDPQQRQVLENYLLDAHSGRPRRTILPDCTPAQTI